MSDPSAKRSGATRLAFGMAILGAFGVESRLDAVTIVFWRSVFGAAFMLAWCVATRRLLDRNMTARSFALTALAGSCLVLSWAAFFAAIAMTSIATATILFQVQPFLVILLAALVFGDKVTGDQLLWMAAAFVGLLLASGLGLSSARMDGSWWLGIGVALAGALCHAVTAIVGGRLGAQRPEVTTLVQTAMGVVLFAPFVHLGQHISATSWGWLSGIGVIHSGMAGVIIYSAFPLVSTPLIAVLGFMYPLVAILIDWWIYGHPLGPLQVVGLALIVAGTLGLRLGWRAGSRAASQPAHRPI